jgi:iron complex outermembrane receptor protein
METPLAITAFTQDFLDRQGIHTARDLAGTAPNVQFGTGPTPVPPQRYVA